MTDEHSAAAGKAIVIAEDELLIALLAEEIVEEIGGRVVGTAQTSDEVLELIRGNPVDAILLDVHLASGSSEPVVIEARNLGIPVILSTGSEPTTLPETFQGLPFVRKPWTMSEIERAFRDLFG